MTEAENNKDGMVKCKEHWWKPGRPTGKKDGPFTLRQRRKYDALLFRGFEDEAKIDGYRGLAHWLWAEAKTNAEWKQYIMQVIMDKLAVPEVGEEQANLALTGMIRDVMVAEANAQGAEAGNSQNVQIVMPSIAADPNAIRVRPVIDVTPMKALEYIDPIGVESDKVPDWEYEEKP